jgi:ribonuclease HII
MLAYEKDLFQRGYNLIAGTDEAGRGPLAGPVVASAVILNQNIIIHGVNDSKKLTESQRERLYEEIQEKALAVGIGIVQHEIIDQINILQASLEAMKLAVSELSIHPDFLLVDGRHLPSINLPMRSIIRGDSLSASIASASIIAKVTRDRMMLEFDKQYPQYGFKNNKGYPTSEHLYAINLFGPCEIHRKSFGPVSKKLNQPQLPLI